MSGDRQSGRGALRHSESVTLVRVGPGRFLLPAGAADWVRRACAEGDVSCNEVSFDIEPTTFLGSFLADAEDHWQREANGSFASGVFDVEDGAADPIFVEVHAESQDGSPVLRLELVGVGTPNAQYQAVRAARSAKLELERARAELAHQRSSRRETDPLLRSLPFSYLRVDPSGRVEDVHPGDADRARFSTRDRGRGDRRSVPQGRRRGVGPSR